MFRGLHNWLIKIVQIVECVCEYCRQSSRWYLMFSRQLFIFLERSPDCFSVGASIINKAAWNQCYISLDNGRDDAATSQHHHGKWSLGPGSQQQVVPLVPVHPPPGVAGPGHASLHFLIYKMGRKNCRHHREYFKWWWWWWWWFWIDPTAYWTCASELFWSFNKNLSYLLSYKAWWRDCFSCYVMIRNSPQCDTNN